MDKPYVNIQVGHTPEGLVTINLSKFPVGYVSMRPEMAKNLANYLLKHATLTETVEPCDMELLTVIEG